MRNSKISGIAAVIAGFLVLVQIRGEAGILLVSTCSCLGNGFNLHLDVTW